MGEGIVDRRNFLIGGAGLLGLGLLEACSSKSTVTKTGSTKRPSISSESGNMSILEWEGYEAKGTKAQKYPVLFGKTYTDKFGADGLTYSYITNDDQSLQKAASGGPFDIMHPCNEVLKDFVDQGLVQEWDTSLIPSFGDLNPSLVEAAKVNGKQYMIPWDWGYGSLLYRTDLVDPADATGWELAWNPKYSGKISLWNGASTNFEIAALKLGFPNMDNLTPTQLEQAKQALIEQKPLNKLYWSSEYSQQQPNFKSGTTWITYSWQDSLIAMQDAGLKCAFMQPSQGRLSWLCGFVLGAKTENYYHAHDYVESYINHASCVNMTNYFYYGTANATVTPDLVKNKTLAKSLDLSNPNAITTPPNHLQDWAPNRSALELAWQEVQAS